MELLERARQWANHDPDPATACALSADIEAAERGDEEAAARVRAAMNGPLELGPAGLRGVVGPGGQGLAGEDAGAHCAAIAQAAGVSAQRA